MTVKQLEYMKDLQIICIPFARDGVLRIEPLKSDIFSNRKGNLETCGLSVTLSRMDDIYPGGTITYYLYRNNEMTSDKHLVMYIHDFTGPRSRNQSELTDVSSPIGAGTMNMVEERMDAFADAYCRYIGKPEDAVSSKRHLKFSTCWTWRDS